MTNKEKELILVLREISIVAERLANNMSKQEEKKA